MTRWKNQSKTTTLQLKKSKLTSGNLHYRLHHYLVNLEMCWRWWW